MSQQLLVVFGATGNQGGSVIRAVQEDDKLSSQFKIRGITRDTSKPAAQKLAAKGVEVVSADMGNIDSLANAVKDAHTVFLVTDFWSHMNAATEIAQGKAVIDASKAAGVQHIIVSSLINTTKASEGRLSHISHFDGKSEIEAYARQQTGMKSSFYLPGMFMTGYIDLIQKVPAAEGESGESYLLAMPIDGDKAQVPLLDVVADTGRFVNIALKNPDKQGFQILGATKYYTPNEIVRELGEVLGRPAKFQQVDQETFKGFLPKGVQQELLENMLLLGDVGYYAGASLDETHALTEGEMKSWKQFVQENKEKFTQK